MNLFCAFEQNRRGYGSSQISFLGIFPQGLDFQMLISFESVVFVLVVEVVVAVVIFDAVVVVAVHFLAHYNFIVQAMFH